MRILVDQPFLVFLDEALNLDRLRDARRGDAEKFDVAVVIAVGVEPQIDAEGAHRPAIDQDRHADEAELLFGQLGTLRGAIEKCRFLADARHDDRPAALDDLADDAFAQTVANGVGGRLETIRGFDVQLPVVAKQGDEASDGAVVLGQHFEHTMETRAEIQSTRERLADFEQRGQSPRLSRVSRGGIGNGARFSHSAGRRRPRSPHR